MSTSQHFQSANLKLQNGGFNLVDLPAVNSDPVWKDIQIAVDLTLNELISLKNYAAVQAGNSIILLNRLLFVLMIFVCFVYSAHVG